MSTSEDAYGRLAGIVGPERISWSPFQRFLYSHDFAVVPKLAAIWWKLNPDIIVLPRNTSDVSRVVMVAKEMGLPVIPRGGGNTMAGDSVAVRGGVLMDMRSMNHVLKVDATAGKIEAEAGCVWLDAMKAAESAKLLLPIHPLLAPASTLGGTFCSGLPGYGALKYGSVKDWVTGWEIVLADGAVIDSTTMKSEGDLTPANMTSVLSGSEGTLAVVTKMTLKTLPAPEETKTLGYSFSDLPKAAGIIASAAASSPRPQHVHFLDGMHSRFRQILTAGSEPRTCEVFVVMDGTKDEVATGEKTIDALVTAAGGAKMPPNVAAETWAGRFNIFKARRISGGLVAIPATLPAKEIGNFAVLVKSLASSMKMNVAVTGLMMNENTAFLTPYYLTDQRRLKSQMALGFVQEMSYIVDDLGGRLRGIGFLNAFRLKYMLDEASKARRGIKHRLDPDDLMNPGKAGDGITRYRLPWFRKVHPSFTEVRLGLLGGMKRYTFSDKYDQPPKKTGK